MFISNIFVRNTSGKEPHPIDPIAFLSIKRGTIKKHLTPMSLPAGPSESSRSTSGTYLDFPSIIVFHVAPLG
ncbi:MAG: hypothetical protein V3U58_06810 [Thermodesulfobacteriota bacterium]